MNKTRSKSLNVEHSPLFITEPDPTTKFETCTGDSSSSYLLFDLINKYCHSLTLHELLTPSHILSKKPCVLYLKVDNKETIEKLFKTYKFNPLIQSECCEWSFKEKDYVMYLNNCFFIAISDCSINEDIENPIQIKMLVYPDMMIVIALEKAYFIENLFKTELNFTNFPNFIDPDDGLYLITGNRDTEEIIRSFKKISIENGTPVEIYLYRFLDSIISRYEKILFSLLIECQTCVCYSTEISYKERAEYLVRVSVSEKSLIYFSQLVNPKKKIIKALKMLGQKNKQLGLYCKSLKDRVKKMKNLSLSGKKLLVQAKALYRTYCEDKNRSATISSEKLAKFYSGIIALFLPLNLIILLLRTKLRFPGNDKVDLEPFFILLALFLGYLVVGILYLRRIGWL